LASGRKGTGREVSDDTMADTGPVVEGKLGLVAATLSPIAVLSGLEALRRGGNASDAAATVALTQIATALGS
jgi:gamma-glutamyltranspeptidase